MKDELKKDVEGMPVADNLPEDPADNPVDNPADNLPSNSVLVKFKKKRVY